MGCSILGIAINNVHIFIYYHSSTKPRDCFNFVHIHTGELGSLFTLQWLTNGSFFDFFQRCRASSELMPVPPITPCMAVTIPVEDAPVP